MPKPYNFFQFSSGFIGSGLVSTYPSLFSGKFYPDGSYSGVFTPEGLYNTPKAYLFGVEDNIFTPANINIIQSGDLSSTNLHIFSTENRISGEFFPVVSESGSITCLYSGRLSGDNIDSLSYQSLFTGDIRNEGLDAPTYLLIFTGELLKPIIENFSITNIISGEISPQLFDAPTTNLIISGNIVKYERDKSVLEFSMESITWTRGSLKIQETGIDNARLNFSVEYIGWSQLN